MDLLVLASLQSAVMGLLLAAVALFLILLILVQRGRGGGLAGALGGMGGSSAFGAKAGDVFTKITSVAAIVWIALCILATHFGAPSAESRLDLDAADPGPAPPSLEAPLDADANGAIEAEVTDLNADQLGSDADADATSQPADSASESAN